MKMLWKNKWFLLGYGAGAVIFLWLFLWLFKVASILAVMFALAVGVVGVFALNILIKG